MPSISQDHPSGRCSWLLVIPLVVAVGCFQVKQPDGEPGGEPDESSAGVTAEEATPRATIGKTTQEVLELPAALAAGGQLDSGQASASNPLLQSAQAYRSVVAGQGAQAVQRAIQLRNAQSIQDPKPLSHAELMDQIIQPGQPDGIQLPMLPYHQEYAWDEQAQQLVVVHFPARVQEREAQR